MNNLLLTEFQGQNELFLQQDSIWQIENMRTRMATSVRRSRGDRILLARAERGDGYLTSARITAWNVHYEWACGRWCEQLTTYLQGSCPGADQLVYGGV